MGTTKTDTKQKTVSINRKFNLPLSTIWKAWTEPESFKKWWGPTNYTCTYCTIDLRVGGKYLANMKDKEGNEVFGTGTYKEIVPNKKLVMSDHFADSKGNIIPAPKEMKGEWPEEGALITLELSENDGKTSLSMEQEGIPVEMYEDCIQGWQESFDKMENLKWNTI